MAEALCKMMHVEQQRKGMGWGKKNNRIKNRAKAINEKVSLRH